MAVSISDASRIMSEAAAKTQHITVCICTRKRPHLLKRLLQELGCQTTENLFTYSVVVVENDDVPTAQTVVSEAAAGSAVPIRYCTQPLPSIALTRNKAIENAAGDFVAFIDDDEFPTKDWLLNLLKTSSQYSADAVLGPVLPYFDKDTPRWIIKGAFFERPMHPTGLRLDWNQTRTGNVLLKSRIFEHETQVFNPDFRVGSDMDFFKRMFDKGHTYVWCNEAAVYEVVPPARWKRRYLIKKALFRGAFSKRHYTIARSLVAVPAYVIALPMALMFGQGQFMKLVFKLSYHAGRVLASLGIDPVKEPYVPE